MRNASSDVMRCKRQSWFSLVLAVSLCSGVIVLLKSVALDGTPHKLRNLSAFDPYRFGHGRLSAETPPGTGTGTGTGTAGSGTLLGQGSDNALAAMKGTAAKKPHCANNGKLSPQTGLLTVDPMGQLGNNMFQYASLLGLARMNNRTAFVLPKSPIARVFRITRVKNLARTDINKWRGIGEPSFGIYNPSYECLPPGPLLLQCYLQSFKYFGDIAPLIRREFAFQSSVEVTALKLLKQLPADLKNATKVGVHIRRGDKLTQKEIKSGERIAPVSYFKNAFDWMRTKYERVVFLVTSDDLRWAKASLQKKSDVIIMPQAPGAVHLCLLTKCDHTIMSVGSFGWWAGWLAGGDVIYYNQPLVLDSWKGHRMKMEDFYPNHWIGLGS